MIGPQQLQQGTSNAAKRKAPFVCLWLFSSTSRYPPVEGKENDFHDEGRVPKNHSTFFNKTINPHPTILPQSNFTLLPDQNNASKIKLDPIKDSALNIVSLNIRSLTIKENSVKLKRIFKLDAAIIVLTEVSVDSTAYMNLC